MKTLVRAWRGEWQLWKATKKNAGLALERAGELESLRIPDNSCCAIPARSVVAVPFWVEATDDATAREIALLEIEMKGLASGERLATDVEVAILQREKGRVLVRGIIFPTDWPGRLGSLKGSRFLPSPLLANWGVDAVHLWRELDDLVAVVVWNDRVVCWETTHWPEEPAEVATWLRRLMIQLEAELKLPEPFQLKEWFGVFAEVPDMFRRVSSLSDGDREKGPTVRTDAPFGNWLPAPVRILQAGRQKKRDLLRMAGGALALVIALASVFVVMNLRLGWRIQETDREVAHLEAEIAPLRAIAAQWTQVEAAVDERFHPLEVLRELVSAIPPSGLRLTVFQLSEDRVLVEGEAENVSTATEFFRAVQSGAKSGFHWEMAAPALQPNNTARFAITGDRGTDGQ